MKWLHQQQIETMVDVEESIQCKHEMSVTKMHVKKNEKNVTECHEVADDSYGLKHCRTIDEKTNEE